MRALVLKEFGELVVEDRPAPVAGDGEVLLEIISTGICGSDLHGFTGENGRRAPGMIMGHESVGRVAALGSGTETYGLEVGSLATFNPVVLPPEELSAYAGREQHCPRKKVIGVAPEIVAGFAQLITVPARNVVALPASMPAAYGALIEPIAVAVHAVRRAQVRAGQTVLVVGGGPIGQSVVAAAFREGATRVLVSEPDPARRELCVRLGAEVVPPGDAPFVDRVTALAGGLVDAALDAVGVSGSVADALVATAFGGTVCLVGMGAPQLALDAYRVSTEERTLVGSFTYTAQDFRDAAAWVATAPPELAALISREVSLDDAPATFVQMAAGDQPAGKILVRLEA
jgi:threonine dehydrogenase-like Zn-dependent dehydrogenase